VVIDSVPEPKRYGELAEKWQWERNERVIPAAEFVAGLRPDYKGAMSFWEGYQKGCDKSGTIARICCWWLAYSRKPLRIYVGAKDAEQAAVIYEFMEKTAKLNKEWLGKKLEFTRNKVTGLSGSVVKILPADAAGTAGITPDVIIAEELTTWSDRDFWNQLLGATGKRAGKDAVTGEIKGYCLLYVITNAGYVGSWQHDLRKYAETDSRWSFFEQPQNTIYPSWLSEDIIASLSEGMTPWEAERLWRNRWIDPSLTGERFFSSDDIDACVGVPKQPPPTAKVYLGIDYGEKKDRTALSVVWMDENGVIQVPEVTCWQGSPDEPVKLSEVEQWIRLQKGRYPNAIPVFDPHQLLYLMQKFETEGVEFRRFDFRSGKNNLLMGENLRFLFKQRKIVLSLFTGLIGGSTIVDELKQLIAQEKSYGIRMQHSRNAKDDRAVSLGMAALCAIQEQEKPAAEQKVRPPADREQEPKKNPLERNWAAKKGLFGLPKL